MGDQNSQTVSTRLRRIEELAQRRPKMALTTLGHYIDMEWLREAQRRTRRDGASGVDGQTAEEYERDLEENLQDLLGRFKTGSYYAPPVKRRYVPKADGSPRPIGIPTYEDKILQRAVAMVLETIYEQDFLDCSYGYRPGRSAHQAIQAWNSWMTRRGGGWVIELDIQGFFDHLDHRHLRSFLDQRVRDGVLRRTIHKWLKAGVLEDGQWRRTKEGTPQGGVVSPILANIYLHEVLDLWFHEEVLPRLSGDAILVRYADDAILGFASESDARRVFATLPKRFERFGLRLHPEKTRLLPFHPPRAGGPRERGPRGRTFDFLGFTFTWRRTLNRRHWLVQPQTASSRLHRSLRDLSEWCRRHRHLPIPEQHRVLCRKLRGHYAYYGMSGNARLLRVLAWQATRSWVKWLRRRSQRTRITWRRWALLRERFPLPAARIVHRLFPSVSNP